MSKPRQPNSLTKRKILARLDAEVHGLSCQVLAEHLGISECATRIHLVELINDKACTRIRVAKDGGRPWYMYGVTTRPLTPAHGFSLYAPAKRHGENADDENEDDHPIVRFHVPAGQWRADHIPAVRSVFDLGVGA